ncbi:MAG: alanyl-tRNA editing protein [Oscillospiraceae bacterium]|nr:alanyl-tRNA editing protein [Oscillospiraceae bacterium]
MTTRLFDEDSHLSRFEAVVVSCTPEDGRYAVVLDRTAFFPLGGGQQPDTGTIAYARVSDVREKDRVITHYIDKPLYPGAKVRCEIDWPQRFRRMQNHSGEHIVSGLVHRKYGYDNVGFHMGSEDVTIDFSGELTRAQLDEIETEANEAVWKNLPVTARYPSPEELAELDYRAKLELTENVRIVTIEGIDNCACCAPHVSRTGEIGAIRLLDFIRYKGGVRVHLLCGADAMENDREKSASVRHISNLLSVKQADAAKAVDALSQELEETRRANTLLEKQLARALAESAQLCGKTAILFAENLSPDALREFANCAVSRAPLAAAFTGSDAKGWNYVLGSASLDLKALAPSLNAGLSGRGGGSRTMLQGHAGASEEAIRAFFESCPLF